MGRLSFVKYLKCINPSTELCCVCLCVVCVYAVAFPAVTGLQLFDVTPSTMKARWDSVDGVSGYMLLYAPLTDNGDLTEKEVMGEKKQDRKEEASRKEFVV